MRATDVTADAAELPLFPLQAVLFPGGRLSLKIFEARYLDLIGVCVRERRPFGVVMLRSGHEVRRAYDQRPATFVTLASHFFATFPQLEGIGFSHRWGGAIDTCSRFCAFFGTAHHGRVAYALGYTGLGVGASGVPTAATDGTRLTT